MGAACTHLDVSPEAARAIRNYPIHISDASFETIWPALGPYLKSAVERHKIRRLLKSYLETTPFTDRYLVIRINDTKWMFEITSHRRTAELTELVLSQRPKA
jgi:hypothetical protein